MMSLRNAIERTTLADDTPALIEEVRAAISGADEATWKHVRSLLSSADTALDEAQPLRAGVLGVENPDIAQDAALERSEDDEIETRTPSRLAIAQLRAVASRR